MKQVAAILNIAPRTVAFHKYGMMGELGIRTRNASNEIVDLDPSIFSTPLGTQEVTPLGMAAAYAAVAWLPEIAELRVASGRRVSSRKCSARRWYSRSAL